MSDSQASPKDANIYQAQARTSGDLLVWTIYKSPSDFPDDFVLRPHSSRTGKPCDFFLTAKTLEQARELLPWRLTRIDRHPSDDAVIVETWI